MIGLRATTLFRSTPYPMTSFIASWCHWDEMGSVPNRLGAESHTKEFRAACEEVW